MKSIWVETKLKNLGQPLSQDIHREVVIVGGGLAGVLVAHWLLQQKIKPTIIEANTLFSGVTQNTTAHITANQGYVYFDLPFDKAKKYYASQMQAIKDYEKLIKAQGIDCDFERTDDHLFTMSEPNKLKKMSKILEKIGADVSFTKDATVLGFDTSGCLTLQNQAKFNPLKFLNGLNLDGVEIFTHTRVKDIDLNKKILYTDNNKIFAKKIIIATNYPIKNLKGVYIFKLYKSQSYVVSVKSGKEFTPGLYQSDIENGLTFRDYLGKIIIGGLDHRTGRVNNKDKFERMQEIAQKYFNTRKIENFWTANDCITYDSMPLAGPFSKAKRDIFVITGFNKWGMANAMICSRVVSNLIAGKFDEYAKLFSPFRMSFSLKGLLVNLGVAIKNLVLLPLAPACKSCKTLKRKKGDVVNAHGKKAVYYDKDGNIHACTPFCSHMGCQLQFNPNTLSWDCPCHGSRFDVEGKIITAPATENLQTYNIGKVDKKEKQSQTKKVHAKPKNNNSAREKTKKK